MAIVLSEKASQLVMNGTSIQRLSMQPSLQSNKQVDISCSVHPYLAWYRKQKIIKQERFKVAYSKKHGLQGGRDEGIIDLWSTSTYNICRHKLLRQNQADRRKYRLSWGILELLYETKKILQFCEFYLLSSFFILCCI